MAARCLLARNVRRLREHAGLTQHATADRAGLDIRHFQKVEHEEMGGKDPLHDSRGVGVLHGESSGNVRGSTGGEHAPLSARGNVPANPRAGLVGSLAAGLQTALAAGDVVAAQVMHEVIGKLLAAGQPGAANVPVSCPAQRER